MPAIAAAVLAFGFAGYQIYSSVFAGPPFEEAQLDFGPLPVVEGKRLGARVGATLNDATWLDKPRAEQRKDLEAAFESTSTAGFDTLLLLSKDGKVVATVQRGRAGKTVVQFR